MTPPDPPGPPRGPRRPPKVNVAKPRPRASVARPRGLGSVARESAPQPVPAPAAVPSRRVLVVDDDESVRSLLARIVQRAGYSVDLAKDGGEAIQKIASLGPDGYGLILLDLMMPNIDGFEVIEHFKNHQPDLLKKIVVVTASPKIGEDRIKREILLSVVQKPFDIHELSESVKRWLG